jgi:hypothetical protein
MQTGRRSFLGKTVSGLAALAALLSPARALAWRRRRVVCDAAVPCPVPLVEMQPRSDTSVTICHPTTSTNPPYCGVLFAWGYYGSSVVASSIACTSSAGTLTQLPVPIPGTTNTWGCFIYGLSTSSADTLTVSFNYKDPMTMTIKTGTPQTRAFTPDQC